MGLLDSILGNLTGSGSSSRGSTSPLTKALMMLLAAKAYQHYTSRPGQSGAAPSSPSMTGRNNPNIGGPSAGGGGLGGMLGGAGSGGLGGLLGGGLGGILGGLVGGGGLNSIVDQFRNTGHGNIIDSWVGTGANQPIDSSQLGAALGPDTVDELAGQTGMGREEVLSELAQELPDAVDRFTPDGRVPTPDEVSSRWV
jgi:uncharacterized protein YidB (DUF937 family)